MLRLLRRWLGHECDPKIDQLILPPTYGKGMETHDDALRVKTEARRKAADSIHARARHIETGAPVSDLLRRVK